jgi:hypothetical protein
MRVLPLAATLSPLLSVMVGMAASTPTRWAAVITVLHV